MNKLKAARLMAQYGASAQTIKRCLKLRSVAGAQKVIDEARIAGTRMMSQMLRGDAHDLEQSIALAVVHAQEMHEASYVPSRKRDLQGIQYPGHYALEWEACWQTACEQQGLPPRLWRVLHLANHWSNDLAECAKEVLDG